MGDMAAAYIKMHGE